jgi:hypothetical protein
MTLTEGNKTAPDSEQNKSQVRDGLDIEVRSWFLLMRKARNHHGSSNARYTTCEAGDANTPTKSDMFEQALEDDGIDNASYCSD